MGEIKQDTATDKIQTTNECSNKSKTMYEFEHKPNYKSDTDKKGDVLKGKENNGSFTFNIEKDKRENQVTDMIEERIKIGWQEKCPKTSRIMDSETMKKDDYDFILTSEI